MPKSVAHEATLYPLPEDTMFACTLQKVEAIEVPFTIKNGPRAGQASTFHKWEWEFLIYEGEFTGQTAQGNTEPRITNLDSKSGSLELPKPWVEQILGREIQMGEEVDTDSLLSLPCRITVRHLEPRPKKDGNGFWHNVEVCDVWGPVRGEGGGVVYDKPPF